MKFNVDVILRHFYEKNDKRKIQIEEVKIKESDERILIEITLDIKLSFKTHVQSLLTK